MAIIVCFFICWTPYHVQKLAFIFITLNKSWNETSVVVYQYSHHIAGCLFYVNCMLNPFLYSLCSQRFRTELCKIFKCITALFCSTPCSKPARTVCNGSEKRESVNIAVRYKAPIVSGIGESTNITFISKNITKLSPK